jgi:hypothetical protein
MGMNVAHRIVHMHGGSLDVDETLAIITRYIIHCVNIGCLVFSHITTADV